MTTGDGVDVSLWEVDQERRYMIESTGVHLTSGEFDSAQAFTVSMSKISKLLRDRADDNRNERCMPVLSGSPTDESPSESVDTLASRKRPFNGPGETEQSRPGRKTFKLDALNLAASSKRKGWGARHDAAFENRVAPVSAYPHDLRILIDIS